MNRTVQTEYFLLQETGDSTLMKVWRGIVLCMLLIVQSNTVVKTD